MAGSWSEFLDPTYNQATAGAVLPAAGPSVAAAATGYGRRQVTTAGSNPPDGTGPGAGIGSPMPAGNIVIGLLVFVVFLLAIMFVAHKWGYDESDFANLKATAYNVLFIALVAVAGIPVVKVLVIWLSQRNVPLMNHAAAWVVAA